MEGARWARWRWRMRGAWLWPSFVVLTVADALVGHSLPPAASSESVFAAGLIAWFAMLIAIVLLSAPLGLAIRRLRRDMPRVVARNYGGTLAILLVSAGLLAAGLVHHRTIESDRAARSRALVAARAYIEAHAGAPYASDLRDANTRAIEPGSIYRTCVLGFGVRRYYCVVVNTARETVRFDGHEPNSVMFLGVG
jgi:hypothetical protein